MSEPRKTPLTKLRRWSVAAGGTIIIALATAWILYVLGPSTPPPKTEGSAPEAPEVVSSSDVAYLITRAEGGSEPVAALLKDAVEVGEFIKWVLDNGSSNTFYRHNISGREFVAGASDSYKGHIGDRCRKLQLLKRSNGVVTKTEDEYCVVKSIWGMQQ